MEGVLLLATIAQEWQLKLGPGHPVEPQPLITLRPKYGMRMTVERRRESARILAYLFFRQIHFGNVLRDLAWLRSGQIGERDHRQLVVDVTIDCGFESL